MGQTKHVRYVAVLLGDDGERKAEIVLPDESLIADAIHGKWIVERYNLVGRVCGAIEPNQSAANAAVCLRDDKHHGDWHSGFACGPAAAERPGYFHWRTVAPDDQ